MYHSAPPSPVSLRHGSAVVMDLYVGVRMPRETSCRSQWGPGTLSAVNVSVRQITLNRNIARSWLRYMHWKGLWFTAGVAQGRSLSGSCNKNICAQVCEYGFKMDSTGCPTCECDNPCAGFPCGPSEQCVAVKDEDCSGFLCPTSPQCKDWSIVTYCTHHPASWDVDSHYICWETLRTLKEIYPTTLFNLVVPMCSLW
jgi:hypothetical protein